LAQPIPLSDWDVAMRLSNIHAHGVPPEAAAPRMLALANEQHGGKQPDAGRNE
jgi:ethanolamine ammonia-lyase small subunit